MRSLPLLPWPYSRAALLLMIVAMLLASCSGQRSTPVLPKFGGAHTRIAQSMTSTYANTILGTSGLVGYYRLGDIGSITAVDSGPNGFNGTYNGLGTALTQGTAGLIAGDPETSTTSNGSTAGYVAIPRSAAFENPTAVSIETWVKLSSTSSYESLVEYGDHSNLPFKGYGLKFSAYEVAFQLKIAVPGGTQTIVTSAVKPVVGQIFHVVGTYDGTATRLYVNGQLSGSVAVTGSIQYDATDGGFIFTNQGHDHPTFGSLQEVAFYNTALSATQIQNHYATGLGPVVYSDWNTFGDNLARTGYNGSEKRFSTTNVGSLKLSWSKDLGGVITDQPVIATGVPIPNATGGTTPTNVLYIGAENGQFWALNPDIGTPIPSWTANPVQLGSVSPGCGDLPNGQFGITGSPTYDKANNVIYVADGSDTVYALDMRTGQKNWSVNVLKDPNTGTIVGSSTQDHIIGALTYNANATPDPLLYVETAAFCDHVPWHGRIVAIDTFTHQVAFAFFPARTSQSTLNGLCGGGIWGMGGASIDTSTQNVFVATGNIVTATGGGCTGSSSQTFPYGDSIVELDQHLNLKSSSPANVSTFGDSDYGATPMLYNISGCPEQLSAKNKNGTLYTYSVGSSGLSFVNGVAMGQPTGIGQFIGVPAFDPDAGVNLVYTGDPRAVTPFANGLIALSQKDSCAGLGRAWQASVSSLGAPSNDNQAPTVANGVIFFTDGVGDHLWAFAATQTGATGTALFNSGTTIGPTCSYGSTCGVFGAATVDGRVFVGSFNHKLYAFGL